MNDSKSEEETKKIIRSTTDKNELIILLQKVFNDYAMLDSKMKELLNPDNSDVGDVVENFKEIHKKLNKYANSRNEKIEELLKTIEHKIITDNLKMSQQ